MLSGAKHPASEILRFAQDDGPLQAGDEPFAVGRGQIVHPDHDKLRHLVGMHGKERVAEVVDLALNCLDQQQLLSVLLDLVLPAIHGVDLRNDVDAGGQAFLYQLCSDFRGIEVCADGGEHDDWRHRPAILSAAWRATSCAAARYWLYSTNGSAMKAHSDRAPKPMPIGTTAVLFLCRS